MNEPILTSGFPQVAPEPKPFSLYDKPSEVPANPSRDNAQPFNLTPFTFAVAEKVATAANERSLSADVMGQALKGKTPMEYFDELENKVIDVTTTNENKTNDIKKLEDDIKNLRPPQADDSAYRAAMDAFNNLATQAPMAPTLERLNVSDTDKIMLGFALLTGANPNDAIGNFIKVKQGFVDQSNEQAMGQYKLDTTNFGNQMDAAGTRLTNERQSLNDTQQSLNNQYNTRLDAMNSAANRLALNGRTDEANQLRGQHNASAAVQRKYQLKGIYTQEDYNEDAQAARENGFDPAQMIWPPIGVPTATAANIAADNTRADKQFEYRKLSDSDKLKFNREKLTWDKTKWTQNLKFQRDKMAQDMSKFSQSLAETKRYHDIYANLGGIRAAISMNDSARGAFNSMVDLLGEKAGQLSEVNDEIKELHGEMLKDGVPDARKKEILERIKELEPMRATLTDEYSVMENSIKESSAPVQKAMEGQLPAVPGMVGDIGPGGSGGGSGEVKPFDPGDPKTRNRTATSLTNPGFGSQSEGGKSSKTLPDPRGGKPPTPTPKPQPKPKPPEKATDAGKGQAGKDGMVTTDKGRFKKRTQ